MGVSNLYSEKVRQEALTLIAEGLTPLEASRKMGGHPSKTIIRQWAMGRIPVGHRSARSRCTLEQKLAALERLQNGENAREIARELGCSPASLQAWLRSYRKFGADGLKTARDIRYELERAARESR